VDNTNPSLDLGTQLNNQKPIRPKKVKKRSKKQKTSFPKYLPFLFILVAIVLCVETRLYFAQIPLMDQWAEDAAVATLKPKIVDTVNAEYFQYSPAQREQLIEKALVDSLKKYESSIESKADSLRESYKDPEGNTYLYGIDSYNFYKQAKDGDFRNFLGFFSNILHKFITLFNKDASLMQTSFYIPIIFMTLGVIPVYFLTRRISNDIGAFIAATVYAIHPELLKYTLAGIADTNSLNIFFMLCIGWLFAELFYAKNKYIPAIALIALLFLFKYTWNGYFLAAVLIILSSVAFIGIFMFNRLTKKYNLAIKSLIIAIIAGLSIFVIFLATKFGLQFIPASIGSYIGIIDSFWPSAFNTITELRDIGLRELIFRLGGSILLLIALISVFLASYDIIRGRNPNKALVIALIGSIIFIVPSFKALRFLPYAIGFSSILFGVGTAWLISRIRGFIESIRMQSLSLLVYVLSLAAIFVIIGLSFSANFGEAAKIRPKMDDSFYDSAKMIMDVSAEDAKVFVWWDKGHFYDALSDRIVLLKSTPTMPRTYWMARALYTADEDLSRGIMRTLACNNENEAFSKLSKTMDPEEALAHLDNILKRDRTAAVSYLQLNNLSVDLIKSTHCDPKEMYVALSDDMFQRFHNVQYYALWDFTGSSTPDNYTAFMQYDCRKAESYTCFVNEHVIKMDLQNNVFNFQPKKLIVIDGNTTELTLNPEDSNVMIIYKRSTRYNAIIVNEDIADSMYVRLMLFGQTDNFELISDISNPETVRTTVNKVKWE